MDTIQPMWEIDEYAIILRICVWFSPFHAPIIIEMIASESIRVWSRCS